MPSMLIHPEINPVALQLGPLAVHWYGLTYLAAFGLFMFLGIRRLRHEPFASITGAGAWSRKDVEDILFMGVMGVVLGGRIGYCLFYKPLYYLAHPLEVFAVWQGGMSFHGGMLGVIAAMIWFAHSRAKPWLQVADFVAPCVPTGLAAGRVGNFINGELWGRLQPGFALGHGFQGRGRLATAPVAGVSVLGRRAAVVRAAVAVRSQGAQTGSSGSGLFGGLRRVSLYRRVFPRTGCVSWHSVARHEHGAMAVPAHDRRRCGIVVVGPALVNDSYKIGL